MTQQPFELPTMSYPTPTSFYDMLPNDYLNMTLTNQVDSKADMGFGRPYNLPAAAGQLAPAYPTYNELPLFQTPPSFSFPSTSSSVASSMSWESPSTQPSSSLSDDLSQPTVETETEEKEVKPTAKQLGKRKRRSNSVGRIGDKIKRPAGTGFAAMFKALSEEVQRNLVQTYPCCGDIGKKDNSTLLKHWFSKRHYDIAVPEDNGRLDSQPAYTCPSFLSMHPLCKNAKAGRYDSASRHCKSCPGFEQMRAKCRESGMELAPVLLARREFEAVQEFRRDALPGQETYSEPVVNAVFKLLAMMATSKTDSGSTEMSDSESESPEDSASTQEC